MADEADELRNRANAERPHPPVARAKYKARQAGRLPNFYFVREIHRAEAKCQWNDAFRMPSGRRQDAPPLANSRAIIAELGRAALFAGGEILSLPDRPIGPKIA